MRALFLLVETDTSDAYLVMATDMSAGNYTNLIEIRLVASRARVSIKESSLGVGTLVTTNETASDINKIAVKFNSENLSISMNGFEVASSAVTGSLPTTLDRVYLGNYRDNANFVNGTIKSIKYIPKAVSDTQLQELSTL